MNHYSIDLEEETVQFWTRLQDASRSDIAKERRQLSSLINGDVFFDMHLWPGWIKPIFWSTPLTDRQTFILALFLIGNGCPPNIACQWIMSSTIYKEPPMRQRKHLDQLLQIIKSLQGRGNDWYYCDVFHGRYFFLNGRPRTSPTE